MPSFTAFAAPTLTLAANFLALAAATLTLAAKPVAAATLALATVTHTLAARPVSAANPSQESGARPPNALTRAAAAATPVPTWNGAGMRYMVQSVDLQ